MVDKYMQELKKITAPIEEMIKGLSDTHENIEKIREKIRQQGDEVNIKIDHNYDRVAQKLMEQKEELKQQVRETVSKKEKAFTTQLEEVECAQTEVLRIKELNDAVKKRPDQEVSDILSEKKQVIDRMQQLTDKSKKVNLPPVQQATTEFVPIKEALPQFGLLCSVDPHKCKTVDLPKYNISSEKTEVNINTKDDNGDHNSRGDSQVNLQLGGVNDTTQVRDNDDGSYMAPFVSQQVEEMELSVVINGQQIKGSRYSVIVKDYTSVNKPTKVFNNDGKMGKPWGIAFAKNGMWAVADYNHCVCIFDGEDQLVRKIGKEGSGNGRFNCPEGVSFDSDDNLYVADCWNHRIQKFTINGKYLLQIGGEGSNDGKLQYPRGLALHDYKVYVADSWNKRISVFQTDGKFHQNIGSGQLGDPHDIAINGSNQLLVADCGHMHHCIHTFTLDGDHVGKFGTRGAGRDQLHLPHGIAVDLYGFILVADNVNHCVSIFSKDCTFVHCFGSWGSAIGQFHCPNGIAISVNGNIYVSDHKNKRIQIFSNEYLVAHT